MIAYLQKSPQGPPSGSYVGGGRRCRLGGRLGVEWVATIDHKRIGILYIATSLAFFAAGGVLALIMRAQLATPNEHVVSATTYDQLFTIHGTTMVFLVVVPILAGFGNYLLPLMIGARDMAFPQLNALSYWLFLFGGIVLYASFFAKGGPSGAGWRAYPPLTESRTAPGTGRTLDPQPAHPLARVAARRDQLRLHDPEHADAGMTYMRIPLFVWAILTYVDPARRRAAVARAA